MVPAVVAQHAERAAFAVTQRARIARGRETDAYALAHHDARIAAHLDGLRAAGRSGERAIGALPPSAGATFLRAWWDPAAGEDALASMWRREEPKEASFATRVQLAAWRGERLPGAVAVDPATLRLLGATATPGAEALLEAAVEHPDRRARLEGARWLAKGGSLPALEALIVLGAEDDDVGEEAAAALAMASPTLAATWLDAQGDRRSRAVAAAIEMLGEVARAEALLDWLDEPPWARLAASVLATLGGFAIDGERMGRRPRGFAEGPTLDPEDEDVAVPLDAALPWPAPKAVRAAWERVGPAADVILGGRPRDEAAWDWAIEHGCQPVRQRALDRAGWPRWFDVTRPAMG